MTHPPAACRSTSTANLTTMAASISSIGAAGAMRSLSRKNKPQMDDDEKERWQMLELGAWKALACQQHDRIVALQAAVDHWSELANEYMDRSKSLEHVIAAAGRQG